MEHLASTAGTHFDAETCAEGDAIDKTSCRPDFLIWRIRSSRWKRA
ncbi:MAG: hypothetical protein U0792_07575 [Gemmataceae bacterium]